MALGMSKLFGIDYCVTLIIHISRDICRKFYVSISFLVSGLFIHSIGSSGAYYEKSAIRLSFFLVSGFWHSQLTFIAWVSLTLVFLPLLLKESI
jgi:hypothetical protein